MSYMKKLTIRLVGASLAVCLLLLGSQAWATATQSTYTPTMSDYCVQPPFLTGYIPPQVLFVMGKDHKFYYPAYNDASDIDNDGQLETGYKHSFDYYGYFDSYKCYNYNSNSGWFEPYGDTTDKYCTGSNAGMWSGNFLNWVAMSRADVIKLVIYGGYRTSDNQGNAYDVISGEYIPQDGHIWGKEYLGSDAYKLFPQGGTNRALFCVDGVSANGNQISQLKVIPDVTDISGVTVSGGLRAWNWVNVDGNTNICADNKMDLNGDGAAESATLTGLAKYNVSVKVCDPSSGFITDATWEAKHCKQYGSNYRSVGLMQLYGETGQSNLVCSRDMATPCSSYSDPTCPNNGKGECVDASGMYFGLIAGSYTNPKAGGFVRKDLYGLNSETNQQNGQFQTSATGGKGLLIKSIEGFKAQAVYPLSSQWGNPIAEIMFEGLRYWGGKGTPTSAFVSSISSGNNGDNGNYSSMPSWDTPATLFPPCSLRFNLVFSDVYNSFDDDQLPGSAFSSFSSDMSNMNVQTLANQISANESLANKSLVVGEYGTTSGPNTDGRCDAKALSGSDGLGNVRGLCPAEGDLKGSYYPAAVALYGHNSMVANTGTSNVLTYVVAFTSNVPEMRVTTSSGKQALIMPYGKSVSGSYGWNCSTSNTSFTVANVTTAAGSTVPSLTVSPLSSTSSCPTMATVGYYVTDTEYDSANNLKYVKFNTSYDDLGGGDYDLDVLAEYTVCAAGSSHCPSLTGDQVSVTVRRIYSAAGNPDAFGFTAVGVGSDSGTYLLVQHTATPPSGSSWAANPLTTNSQTIIFNAASSTAVLPKPPLWYAAKYGGFNDMDGNGLPYTDYTCDPATRGSAVRNPKCDEWNKKGDGNPDTYFLVSNPSQMEQRLRDALDAILARVSSGTAASILNNSEGSGASLLQAVFYPKKDFDNNTQAYWIGEIHNMWYYLDPFLQNTSIREDTVQDNKLNLKQDRIAQFYFDTGLNKTQVRLFTDANGDGIPDSATPDQTVDPDNVRSLWKAGRKLWARTLATDPRTIYTHTDITSTGFDDPTTKLTTFGTSNISTLTANGNFLSLLTPQGVTADATKAGKLINYIQGTDQPPDSDGTTYRPRKVEIDACNPSSTNYVAGSNCVTSDSNYYREWKLGDIVSSTPKLVASVPLNSYQKPAPNGYGDTSYQAFISTPAYTSRGMVFVGGNDGMLHAFKLGVLKELSGAYDKAEFDNASGTLATSADDLGREMWSFIPKQALPYLDYLSNPNYCHLYYVDKTSMIVDASVGKPSNCDASANYWDCAKDTSNGTNWRTVLVGGMGYGGAAKWNGDTTETAPSGSVKTAVKGTSATSAVGYSSYFALDVTDPNNPKYLWEFPGTTSAAGNLGFTTPGPAIVRIAATTNGAPDNSKNGRWFAVFASGPTGPINTVTRQFQGQSDQQLHIYVVDLADGTLVRTIDTFYDGTSLPSQAFAGSLSTSWIDTDRGNQSAPGWYSDDAVYIGYTQYDSVSNTWSKGGVIRLITNESTDPSTWKASSLISGIGPVTTSVTKLQDRKNYNLWIYFGTGRFFYKGDNPNQQQALYGVKEPCYSTFNRGSRFSTLLNVAGGTNNALDKNCTDPVPSALVDQTGSATLAPASTLQATDPGWFINLAASDSNSSAERDITDPLASPSGAVFFTTFKPSSDICKFGGDSLIWAVRYDTGGLPPARSMQGKALMQVSTGAFAEVSLSSAFSNPTNKGYDGRRLSSPISGVPPTAQGLSLITNPPPVKKFLQIREL